MLNFPFFFYKKRKSCWDEVERCLIKRILFLAGACLLFLPATIQDFLSSQLNECQEWNFSYISFAATYPLSFPSWWRRKDRQRNDPNNGRSLPILVSRSSSRSNFLKKRRGWPTKIVSQGRWQVPEYQTRLNVGNLSSHPRPWWTLSSKGPTNQQPIFFSPKGWLVPEDKNLTAAK